MILTSTGSCSRKVHAPLLGSGFAVWSYTLKAAVPPGFKMRTTSRENEHRESGGTYIKVSKEKKWWNMLSEAQLRSSTFVW